jgi:phosphoribosylformylglycinamidine synthase
MGSIVVDVMLKPEILDPQGQAVGGALPRLGFNGFTDVRQGKRFVLTVDGDVTDEHLAAAREAAETLLSNPVIEDVVSVHVLDESAADEGAADQSAADEADAPAEDADGEPDEAEDGEQ